MTASPSAKQLSADQHCGNQQHADQLSIDLLSPDAEPLATVVRGGVVESVHYGHLVIVAPDGDVLFSVGNPETKIFARSSLKPLQLLASLRMGFTPHDDGELAVAASSHNGEPMHLEKVRQILTNASLTESDLQNTPAYPLNAEAEFNWRVAGHGEESIAQNCSGKHAAFLSACHSANLDPKTYLDPNHPLQQQVKTTIQELTGDTESPNVTIDGCGAPLFSTSLIGLARAFSKLATAPSGTPENQIANAMRTHPELVGGTGRDVTLAMQAVPGLIAKDGAEGVYAGALPDGTAFAFKVLDGSGRPRPAILARTLELAGAPLVLGVDLAKLKEIGKVPVLGHAQPVGQVEPAF